VAVAEAVEPDRAMRAVCLFGVLVLAKTLMLSGRDLPLSVWSPFAFFWQDVLAALVFLALDPLLTRSGFAWLLYGAAVGYIALNVPIALVLGTPLTANMIRAARGPLADSVQHCLTAHNVGSVILVITAGVALPVLHARRAVRPAWGVLAAAILFIVIGVQADSHVDTRGLHRNAFGALVPRALSGAGRQLETAAGFDTVVSATALSGENLEHLRGAAKGRNVVLIVLESTAARYLGLYGAHRDPMPSLTALGRTALVFESAYAVYPESIKGLFATLCSRYPAFNTPAEIHAQVHCTSLAERLATAGYRTALFHSGRFGYLGMAPMIEKRGFNVLEDAGAIGGKVSSSFGVDEPSTVRRMLEWVDSLKRDERFFLMYLPVAGHHPYVSPEPALFEGTGDFDRYLNSLNYGDAALHALFDGLRARNLEGHTLFVVQGDHGEAFGQHTDNFAHSLFIYDENVRVPYLIAAPGLIDTPLRAKRVVSTIDTAPTILDLLGKPVPVEHQGASALGPASRPAFFYTDYSLGWLGLRDSCWKYLYEIDSGRSKLFDVCRDPDETQNRAADFGSFVRAYRDRVQHWAAAQSDAVRHGR
jgi:hypothetical protein